MGIRDLQAFLDSNCVAGASTPVDLLKIVRNMSQKPRNWAVKGQQQHSMARMRLVLDGECCLDRLYGGYFSDWACGGQWNRMLQFLIVFINTTDLSGLELVVYFNGSLESARRTEWIQSQLEMRDKVNNVLKHITIKKTPPPKVLWTPPACLRTSLRMALRHLNVTVLCSMDDHHQEVIGYCRENNFDGIMADDAEYAVFYPPKYFSSEQLKLTYKGSLDTKEYNIPEVLKALDLSPEKLCILAALMGNYILTEHDLADFYQRLDINTSPSRNVETVVKTLANFVKNLPSTKEDVVASQVFGSPTDPRCNKLRQSIQYFINGTKEGFLHYKPIKQLKDLKLETKNNTSSTEAPSTSEDDSNLDMGKLTFASETEESHRESLDAYKQATANAVTAGPQIIIDPPGGLSATSETEIRPDEESNNGHAVNGTDLHISSSSSSSNSSVTSPSHATSNSSKQEKPSILKVVPEVMRTASERHQKGLMSPYIYQILSAGEIKLPVLLEDENHREFPSIHVIYRPIRQMVYAILFNLHHRQFLANKETEKVDVPDVVIKEWIWSKGNPYDSPELVKAEHIGWPVPTIQRLWFGAGPNDKRRRLRGFLTCMKSDTPLILNTTYVPQHLLVMACVLRYIMCFSDRVKILRRHELDAFIAQAFCPDLMNAEYLQDLQLHMVTPRGVQLAALFMAGVETALLANDACGAPIPWLMCCPWLFFDGKLFHHTLARASISKNLLDLCGGHFDRVVKVERMRKAILEGVNVVYARPALPITPAGIRMQVPPQNILPAGCLMNEGLVRGRGAVGPQRGMMRRPVPSRGGQLEIAGVVVGQWGANYGQPGRMPQPLAPPHPVHAHPRAPPRMPPPQVTSIGGYCVPRQFNAMHRPKFQARNAVRAQQNAVANKKNQMKAAGKKKTAMKKTKEFEKKSSLGRGATVEGITEGITNTLNVINPGQFDDAEKKENDVGH